MSAPISIHAPREGGDAGSGATQYVMFIFQSTPPVRGATRHTAIILGDLSISIHAPREGGDGMVAGNMSDKLEFQSTPPVRGATMWR